MSKTQVLLVTEVFFKEKKFWLEKLKRLNIPSILIQKNPITWETEYFIDTLQIRDFKENQAEMDLFMKKYEILSVLCLNEFVVEDVAPLIDHLGLPALANEDIRFFRDKELFRNRMLERGFKQPKILTDENLKFPLILKPQSWSGSIGVYYVQTSPELVQLTQNYSAKLPKQGLEAYHLNSKYILEEFISGEEFSIEALFKNGVLTHHFLTKKFKTPLPYFSEIGHITWPILDSQQAPVREFTEKVGRALGIHSAMVHIEYIESEGAFVPIEVAIRPGGDLIPFIHEFALEKPVFDSHPALSPFIDKPSDSNLVAKSYCASLFLENPLSQKELTARGLDLLYGPFPTTRAQGQAEGFRLTKKFAHIVRSQEKSPLLDLFKV